MSQENYTNYITNAILELAVNKPVFSVNLFRYEEPFIFSVRNKLNERQIKRLFIKQRLGTLRDEEPNIKVSLRKEDEFIYSFGPYDINLTTNEAKKLFRKVYFYFLNIRDVLDGEIY
jgi:hypothetical protein